MQEKNIPVVQDLSVGYNLMDHVSAGAVLFLVNQSVSLRAERILESHDDYVDYIAYHTGPMSIPGGCESVGFIDRKDPKNPDGWPDLELLFNSGSVISEPTLRDNFGIDEALYQKVTFSLRINKTDNTEIGGIRTVNSRVRHRSPCRCGHRARS